jgi:para-nitrobenzyl esterase
MPATAPTRRRFLLSSAALAALPLAGCGGGGDGDDLVARTSSGDFRGHAEDGVAAWLGMPYAQPPVGALRFRAPQPVQPAAGLRDAAEFGAASLQTIGGYVRWIYPQQDTQSEDCLTLNIWSPRREGRLPVIVWLHGGAFRTGATRMPLMNGAGLARGGAVVVTVNYRLGALGLLSHPDFTDAGNGSFANWQMQDMAAALRWVRDNIAAFGGDPQNVCVVGQSGGAMHAAQLAQNPAYRGLFDKAVLLSAPSLPPPASMNVADAAAYTELLAARLGTTPLGLRDVPAKTLHDAELALNAAPLPSGFATGKAFKLAPLIDGTVCLGDWTRRDWPADLPVMISYTLDEGAFWWDLYDPASNALLTPPGPATAAALSGALTAQLGGSAAKATSVIDAYTAAAQAEGRSSAPASLWTDIFGDQLLRNFGVRYAGRLAAAGVPVRMATYMHAVKPPGTGVPHCADIPLWFGTYGLDYYRDKIGAGPYEVQLSSEMSSALVSFARDAQPRLASGADWPTYQVGTATCVRWGENGSGTSLTGVVPRLEQLKVWDAVLGY